MSPCRASKATRTGYPDRVCLPVSSPIDLMWSGKFRGARCYVAWCTKPKGRLNLLSAPAVSHEDEVTSCAVTLVLADPILDVRPEVVGTDIVTGEALSGPVHSNANVLDG